MSLLGFSSPRERSFKDWLGRNFLIRPKSVRLYREALTHRSAVRENAESTEEQSNERLEYLGDAILDAVISEYLFAQYPDAEEGFLTRMRSKVVSREHLNVWGRELGIPDHLIVDTDQSLNTGTLCGNALEALIGAMFLDQGYVRVRKALRKMFRRDLNLGSLEIHEPDPKSRLMERCQKERKKVAFIPLVSDSGKDPHHRVRVEIDDVAMGEGEATNKKKAEQIAARTVLDRMD